MKSGKLNFLEPSETLQAYNGTALRFSLQTVYELPLLPNDPAVKHFDANRSGAKCWLDIYRWGADLAVNGPIRDIGQNV